ncbi:AAA family ATPase [Microbispora triticiradicis]|uniref:AAA family ATPase n=2 Tax=Microbispora TaxID=2005 RepID=A0ABY3LWH5_9ACTN|nr:MULTISPECIES: AAA family ATPase [Microbispora]TLP62310.1 hypothetical protein FED44_10185 [Microbispora fusca]TYB56885.1 AAA family ATPase [Microbispora tritici]
MTPRLAQLRLMEFKSIRSDSVLRMGGMTVFIGRNSSGKSNALDGLEVLSRLAAGADLVDAAASRPPGTGVPAGATARPPSAPPGCSRLSFRSS